MDKTYRRFLASGLDLSPLGLERGGEAYFCTPRSASIAFSERVDVVHYCFVRGCGAVRTHDARGF